MRVVIVCTGRATFLRLSEGDRTVDIPISEDMLEDKPALTSYISGRGSMFLGMVEEKLPTSALLGIPEGFTEGREVRFGYEFADGDEYGFELSSTTLVEVGFDVHERKDRQAWGREQLELFFPAAELVELWVNLDENLLGLAVYR